MTDRSLWVSDAAAERLTETTGAGAKVYIALSRLAGATGMCEASLDEIAGAAGVDRRTVMRAMQRLSSGGLVEIHRRKGRWIPNLYVLKGDEHAQ